MPPSPRYIAKRTQQARLDIAEIRLFTIQQFGRDQWPVYRQRLENAIRRLCQSPQLGRDVSHLSTGLQCFHIGRPKGAHYIYYRIEGKYLVIIRVIHDARDQREAFHH